MDGAARGDLREPLALFVVQVAAQEELEVDRSDLPLSRVAGQVGLDAVDGPALAFGVQPNGEDRSGAEGGEESFGRRRARVLTAAPHGLVDEESMRADARFDLQVAEPGDLHRSCHVFPLC